MKTSSGVLMDAVGASFPGGGFTVMLIDSLPVAPRLSVAVKVMRWMPALREILMDSPSPMVPSRSEVHTSEEPDSQPSSASDPVPAKLMESVVR